MMQISKFVLALALLLTLSQAVHAQPNITNSENQHAFSIQLPDGFVIQKMHVGDEFGTYEIISKGQVYLYVYIGDACQTLIEPLEGTETTEFEQRQLKIRFLWKHEELVRIESLSLDNSKLWPHCIHAWTEVLPADKLPVAGKILSSLKVKPEQSEASSAPVQKSGDADSTCTITAQMEEVHTLGSGIRLVGLLLPNQGFEIGHFAYLYYGDRKLCPWGAYLVSPSGRFVVYQDGGSGKVFLIRRADGQLTQLTSKPVRPVEEFVWHEELRTVEAHFAKGHEVRTLSVP